MRLLTSTILAAALAVAVPAHAHDGHSRRGHDFRHGHYQHHHRVHHRHHHRHHPPAWGARKEVHNYYYEIPAAANPAPGLHVIFPDIFLPWP